jgi:hypothetical protein
LAVKTLIVPAAANNRHGEREQDTEKNVVLFKDEKISKICNEKISTSDAVECVTVINLVVLSS